MNKIRYVRISKFAELTGYTESAPYSKISDGVWGEGVHFRKAPDGHPLMDLEAYEAWVLSTTPRISPNPRTHYPASLKKPHSHKSPSVGFPLSRN